MFALRTDANEVRNSVNLGACMAEALFIAQHLLGPFHSHFVPCQDCLLELQISIEYFLSIAQIGQECIL